VNINYSVNNVYSTTRAGIGTVLGTQLSVIVPEVEVELYDPTGQHGSVQLHFRTPEEQAYAAATFKAGETVTITLPDAAVVEPAPVEEPAAA
jgi:hypothetical protein